MNPGEVVTSLASLAELCGEGVSVRNCRTALARFQKLQFLTNKSTKHGRKLSIVNWVGYQEESKSPDKASDKGVTKTRQRPDKGVTTIKEGKKERKKEYKDEYGQFKNVRLTKAEFDKLYSAKGKIRDLDEYIESTGKKYKSHYAVLLSWSRRDKQDNSAPTPSEMRPDWTKGLPEDQQQELSKLTRGIG